MASRDLSETKINILIMLFVIIVGIIFSQVQTQIGFKNLLYSVLIIGVIFSFSAWIIFKKISQNLEERITVTINECAKTLNKTNHQLEKKSRELESNIITTISRCSEQSNKTSCLVDEQSKAFIDHLKKIFHIGNIPNWIITTEELARFELENAKSEVWIITSDLEEDGIDGPFFKVVEKNMEDGVIYRYFLPNNDLVKTRVIRMKNKLTTHENKSLFFHFLDDDFFFLFSKFDFGIINPNDCRNDRFGFMGINTPDNNNRFQVRISDTLMEEFVGKLQTYI